MSSNNQNNNQTCTVGATTVLSLGAMKNKNKRICLHCEKPAMKWRKICEDCHMVKCITCKTSVSFSMALPRAPTVKTYKCVDCCSYTCDVCDCKYRQFFGGKRNCPECVRRRGYVQYNEPVIGKVPSVQEDFIDYRYLVETTSRIIFSGEHSGYCSDRDESQDERDEVFTDLFYLVKDTVDEVALSRTTGITQTDTVSFYYQSRYDYAACMCSSSYSELLSARIIIKNQ